MFGLGATKAGTSWLYRYLADHPDCALPGIKELHYFDALEAGRLERRLNRLRREQAQLAARGGGTERSVALARWADTLERLAADPSDAAPYLDYLGVEASGRKLVADITPAYSLLPEPVLARMQGLAGRVRFVYLLRDPVDRLWSHVRMLARRQMRPGDDELAAARAVFDDWASGGNPGMQARGDYAAILPRLRRALAPDALWLQFYETMFNAEATEALCRFLGIAARSGDYERRVHAGIAIPLDDERRDRARAILAPQYAHVRAELGVLPSRWQQNFPECAK